LNYVKLSEPSKFYKQTKELFFEEKDRAKALKRLETLFADTIEYYLDGDHWFYADYIEKDLPLIFSNEDTKDRHDIVRDGYRYLILILDKKQQLQPKNTSEDRKMAQALLLQQKKAAFFNNYQDSLVQKAIHDKRAVRYPIVF
jgi:CRISPR/Cas system-associated endonuclease Cas1